MNFKLLIASLVILSFQVSSAKSLTDRSKPTITTNITYHYGVYQEKLALMTTGVDVQRESVEAVVNRNQCMKDLNDTLANWLSQQNTHNGMIIIHTGSLRNGSGKAEITLNVSYELNDTKIDESKGERIVLIYKKNNTYLTDKDPDNALPFPGNTINRMTITGNAHISDSRGLTYPFFRLDRSQPDSAVVNILAGASLTDNQPIDIEIKMDNIRTDCNLAGLTSLLDHQLREAVENRNLKNTREQSLFDTNIREEGLTYEQDASTADGGYRAIAE